MIRFFYSTNKLRETEFMEKHQLRTTDNPDWYFRTTSSSEDPITNKSKILQYTKQIEDQTISKFYRYKYRYSFKLSNKVRLDLTLVKEAREKTGTLAASGTLDRRNKEKYQIELEYTGKDFSVPKLVENLYPHIADLLNVYKNTLLPISQSQNDLIITKYLQFSTGAERLSREDLRLFSTSKFLAMEVEALTRQNLDTIWNDYHVTVKADGEHFLLYINPEYGAFLINNRLETSPVLIKDKVKDLVTSESIWDGELVEYQGRKRFLLFDCFFFEGKDLRDKPLFSKDKSKDRYTVDEDCRFYYVKVLTGRVNNELLSNELLIEAKDYFTINQIKRFFDEGNQFRFRENDFPYNIDGLIFTPSQEKYPKITHRSGRFIKVGSLDNDDISPILKWKPPAYMSVDFRVKFSHKVDINNQTYHVFFLESAYHRSIHPFEPSSYRVKGYNLAYIPLTDGLPKITKDFRYRVEEDSVGHIIKNKDVVEFIWMKDDRFGKDYWGRWFPIKYRDDKTQIGFPNNFKKVADRTWLAINDTQITGQILMKMKPSIQLNMGYYQKGRADRSKTMPHLRDIHNAIKSIMIHLSVRNAQDKNDRLLDLATGRGGDIGKWIGIKYALGIEFDESNLKAGKQSAYSRYSEKIDKWYQMDRAPYLKLDLIQGNMGQLMDDQNFSQEAIYNHILKNAIRRPYNFGIVSCQFAIHYIWDTEEHIDNFFRNVSKNLAPNGYFIATTFNGEKIFTDLKNSRKADDPADKLPRVTGKNSDGELVWDISSVKPLGKNLENFGQKIRVLNKTIKDDPEIEYLVNFPYLLEVAQKHGLFPAHLWFEKTTLPLDGSYGLSDFGDLYGTDFLRLVKNTKVYSEQMYKRLEGAFTRISTHEKKFSKYNSLIVLKKQPS
jgi:hypothetical protein